jgi:hypothetical protein
VPRVLKNSIWLPILPKRQGMSALPDAGEPTPRGSRLARWAVEHGSAPPPAAWLFGEPNDQARELAELRERLAEAEKRAEEAEAALPHLLGLGQRTVNGLLGDARARGREIIEEAKAQAALEAEHARQALALEAAELDSLRMAVACEAMGLEQVRAELEAGLAALQLTGGDPASAMPSRQLPAASTPAPGAVDDLAGSTLPPPPAPDDLASVGMRRPSTSADTPSTRFADAWAQGEDDMLAEAFDRFFAAQIDDDPLRDAVVDPDPDPAADTHTGTDPS